MSVIIRLTEYQHAYAAQAALERGKNNRAAGIADLRCTESAEHPDRIGTFGEVAVCAYIGLDPAIYVRTDAPDNGIDIPLDGLSISVKTRARRSGDLLVPKGQGFLADVAILVWPTSTDWEWEIMGWISRATYEAKREFWDWMPKPCWAVEHRHLEPIESLGVVRV